MSYSVNFKAGDIVSASQVNENFTILRDNLEVYENLSSQINGITTDFSVNPLNFIQASTQSLVQVVRNGRKQILSSDFIFASSQVIRFIPTTNIPQVGETVEVTYRKAVS